jgi:hypothetical protein
VITIELYGPALACVVSTPSLLRRLLLRAEATERYAVRVLVFSGGYTWRWDSDGGPLPSGVLHAIEDAVRASRRPRARAVEPPG